ncbi:hypothetical protein, partial [Brevibacillus migulae]|uniref:hypothetical protein n=1 Tax=Brevibacillus migulae TaxID=1644114 RepID=UPI00196B1773
SNSPINWCLIVAQSLSLAYLKQRIDWFVSTLSLFSFQGASFQQLLYNNKELRGCQHILFG